MNNKGRSIVEMLGVLAIIGVLSVGALAGYSKAMLQHKFNRQTEQINTIVSALLKNYDGLVQIPVTSDQTSFVSYLKSMGEIPQDMYNTVNQNFIKDSFQTRYQIYHHKTNYVAIVGWINNSDVSNLVCQNIYKTLVPWSLDIKSVQILRNYEGNTSSYTSAFYGDQHQQCSKQKNRCLRDLKISDLQDLCCVCQDTTNCRVFIFFKDAKVFQN